AVILSVNTATNIITLKNSLTNTYNLNLPASIPTVTSLRLVAVGNTTVAPAGVSSNGLTVTVTDASVFRVGDIITKDGTNRATITQIQSSTNTLTLDLALPTLAAADTLRIANFPPTQRTLRLADVTGLYAGGVVLIS